MPGPVVRFLPRLLAAVLPVVACATAPPEAPYGPGPDIDALARRADVIVRGRAESVESRWNDDRTLIRTSIVLFADRVLKGAEVTGREVLILAPGGAVGDVGQRSSDEVIFDEGEDVVVFLRRAAGEERESFEVVDGARGKFAVTGGLVDGRPVDSFLEAVAAAVAAQQAEP